MCTVIQAAAHVSLRDVSYVVTLAAYTSVILTIS